MAHHTNEKKRALLGLKEEILRDITYFEKRIKETRSQKTDCSYFDEDDDSDNEYLSSLDMGPSVYELKSQQTLLQTCLHATQELTNLCVLQSEVNVMVNDPVYEREPPVTEEGIWREVTADCKVDLVPFSITFYVHKASRRFGPTSYRGLRVTPVKASHETELANSSLPRVGTPSDAIEVIRGFAAAHRSRRTTLARLAEKFPGCLFMEPMSKGGYVVRCADLLEVSWTLESRWSPVAAFHHRMKFDLEYMEEAYVRAISQAHRELSDPALETDERTRLMSKIIATCLEARGPTQELYESMESDIESENLRKRRTTLDEQIDEPVNKKKKDSEVMAPPKSLPKKTKPKGKENSGNNKKEPKPVKRPVTDVGHDEAKKAKLSNQDSVHKNSVATIKSNADKENVGAINKVLDTGASKKYADKEVVKSKSYKEKPVAETKKSNQDNVAKTTKHNVDKENIANSKKVSDNKSCNVKNKVASSQVTEKVRNVKSKDPNVINSTDKSAFVRDNVTCKKPVDKEVTKDKPVKQKTVADTNNSNNKPDKMPVNVHDSEKAKDFNSEVNYTKKVKANKISKTVQETDSGKSMKTTSAKVHNIEGSSHNNNEQAHKAKVSKDQRNVAIKGKNLGNVNDKTSNKKLNTKIKSAGNVKENVATIDDNMAKNNKISATQTLSTERLKSANPTVLDPGNLKVIPNNQNIKIVTNANIKTVDPKSSDNIKSKSKENLNDNIIKTKGNVKNIVTEKLNKQILHKESTKHKEKPSTSAVTNENAKFNQIPDEAVKKSNAAKNNANLKKSDTLLVVKKSINSNKADKINIDKNYIVTNEDDAANIKKVVENVASVNKKLATDLNERNSDEIIENIDRNSLKTKHSTNKQFISTNNNKAIKNIKTDSKVQNNAKNNTGNLISSKNLLNKGIQKKIKLLNPKNKTSTDKPKLTNYTEKQNDTHKDISKAHTKIPRKLMSVREHMIKKIPLRISPRKLHSNTKTNNTQDLSKSSQGSLQKPTTGIPRLMKKPSLKS